MCLSMALSAHSLAVRSFARVISGMVNHGAAIAVEPVTDTVKVVKGNMVVETLDRSVLRQAQTPQGSEILAVAGGLEDGRGGWIHRYR